MEENRENHEIYSKKVKAGKRTYFFDVKATRANDYYLTITESKKKFKDGEDGHFYEKHKIFLYKEDLNKFLEALNETAAHIKKELMPGYDFAQFDNRNKEWDSIEPPTDEDADIDTAFGLI